MLKINLLTKKHIYIVLFGLAIISALFVLFQSFRYVSILDYTYQVENAYRIFLGQLPYRDFFLVLTPGTYYVMALIMKILGTSNLYFTIFCMIIQFLTISISFCILNKLIANKNIALLLLIPILFTTQVFDPHPHYDSLSMIFILLAILVSLTIEQKGYKSITANIFVGILATMSILFKQNLGVFFLLSYVLISLVILIKSGFKQYYTFFGIIIGSMTVCSVFYFWLYQNGIVDDFIYQTFIFPSQERNFKKTLFDIFINIRIDKIFFYVPIMFSTVLILVSKFNLNFRMKQRYLELSLIVGLFVSLFLIPLFANIFIHIDWHFIYYYQINIRYVVMLLLFVFFVDTLLFSGKQKNSIISYLPLSILFVFGSALITGKLSATRALRPLFSFSLAFLYPRLEKNFQTIRRGNILNYLIIFVSLFLCIFVFFVKPYIQIRPDKQSKLYISQLQYTKNVGVYGSLVKQMDDIVQYIQKNIPENDSFIEIPGEDPIYFLTQRKPVLEYFQLNYITLPYDGMYVLQDIMKHKIKRIIHKKFLQGSKSNIDSFERSYDSDIKLIIRKYPELIHGISKKYGLYESFKYYDVYKLEE